jgi:hypothetical protein
MCTIEGDDFITLSHDVFVASASMMPKPAAESHGYSNPLDSWAVFRFLGGKGISDHYSPVTMQSTLHDKTSPNLASYDDDFTTFLYNLMTSYLHLLGSASWCTRYGSARKRTYSNQPIFLFPEQNGRRFD